jgi:hypothetical protein
LGFECCDERAESSITKHAPLDEPAAVDHAAVVVVKGVRYCRVTGTADRAADVKRDLPAERDTLRALMRCEVLDANAACARYLLDNVVRAADP